MKRVTVIAQKSEMDRVRNAAGDFIYNVELLENDLVRVDIYVNDALLDKLIPKLENSVDLRHKDSVIEVSSPDFIISSSLKRKERKAGSERATVEELLASSKKYAKIDFGKTLLTIIAGLIALIGLFLNNVPIIIGAMLLSPLLGPIYSFVINTSVGREKDAFLSIANLTIMLILVLITSSIATLTISAFMHLSLTTEILLRFDTNPIYIIMALLLGFAAVFAYAKGLSESIAGIAIAAAILPPMVVSGIALALYMDYLLRPLILSMENIVGLVAGGLIAIIVLRIEPRRYYEKARARKMRRRTYLTLTVLLAILVLLAITI
ncbi:TIGR00341 family protein [Aciduliprofundum sp. MAR08-339]|uniref:TIGR00341 family protein n=1 Tax=Aciduliprofundum sp. (strain MAR08-339) TaxID=673860 RepID=UPI0002A4A775|nr:TIGR00341 family protein [Aciduliprofundum sp. MAR08-339]